MRSVGRELHANTSAGRSAGHHTVPSWASSDVVHDSRSLRDKGAGRSPGLPAGGITCQGKAREKLTCGPAPD